MAKLLQTDGGARIFETAEAANDYLTECGLRQQSRSVRTAAALLDEIDSSGDKMKEIMAGRDPGELPASPASKPTPADILALLEKESETPDATPDV